MTEIPNKRFFRPDEVAVILEEPIRTIYRWLKDKKIIHIPHGRKKRIPRAELERVIREGIN